MDLRSSIREIYNGAIDLYLGIRTDKDAVRASTPTPVTTLLHADPVKYVPTDYLVLAMILRRLKLRSDDVFFDIGCGLGRALCLAARRPIAKCVGIEYDERLAHVARLNSANLRGRKSEIEIVTGDAAQADYSQGTIFYLYNPFGERTVGAVLEAIRATVRANPRAIRIAYFQPDCEHVLSSCGWLERYDDISLPFVHAAGSLWQAA